jgi:hypothetical protein
MMLKAPGVDSTSEEGQADAKSVKEKNKKRREHGDFTHRVPF